jgi:SAM-dependent methyltransferase
MPASPEATESVWLRRLASGGGFCCLLGSGPGQAVEAFWRDVFSTAHPGSRVLEIGCGSGQVSIWAAKSGRGLEVIASDIHDHPEVLDPHPGVRFLGNAKAESLPVQSASIDMVVSNFAFEYTPALLTAASELTRVLKPGGAAILVLHSDDSAVTAGSRNLLHLYKGLVEADVPRRISQAAALRPDHLSRRKLLKDVLKLRASLAHLRGDLYFEIADRLLANDPKARADYAALEANLERLTDISEAQIQVALSRKALSALKEQFAALGMEVFTTDITGTFETMETQKFGWLMFLNKPRFGSANSAIY